jgi:hypothetical protein
MSIESRFVVESVEYRRGYGNENSATIKLTAATNSECPEMWKYTPAGEISIQTNNMSAAAEFFKNIDKQMTVTFTSIRGPRNENTPV